MNTEAYEIFAKSMLFGSLQFTIAGIETGSKFFILSSVDNEKIMQDAIGGLEEYIQISILIIFMSSLLFYFNYGWKGVGINLTTNLIIMLWIINNQLDAHYKVCKKHQLKHPKLFGIQL